MARRLDLINLVSEATISPFDPSKSDGCTVPIFMHWLMGEETFEQQKCCVEHDRAYWYGGTSQERWDADAALHKCLLLCGMSGPKALSYWLAVRCYGSPLWHWSNPKTWGYGRKR